MSEMAGSLKEQGKAALAMVGLAIVAVLGMVVLTSFQEILHAMPSLTGAINTTITATVAAFIAGLAIFGTFAVVIALIVVVKALVGVVKGLS